MQNRSIQPAPDGSLVLRPGRVYRVVLLINGETTVEALGERLVELGFSDRDLCISTPEEWAEDAPGDWPEEPAIDVCANESLVRASGSFDGDPRQFDRDTPVDDGAAMTVSAAWDYGRAP